MNEFWVCSISFSSLFIATTIESPELGKNLNSEKPRVGVTFVICLISIELKSYEANITTFDPRFSSSSSSYGS